MENERERERESKRVGVGGVYIEGGRDEVMGDVARIYWMEVTRRKSTRKRRWG